MRPPRLPDYQRGQVLVLVPRLKTCPAAAYRYTRVRFCHWEGLGRAVVKVISRFPRERVYITTHAANLARRKPLPTSANTRPGRDRHPPLSLPAGWQELELADASWWHGTHDF